MELSNKQVSAIKMVLQELCSDGRAASAEVILESLKEKTKIDIELYSFRTTLSNLIKDGRISGYQPKVGRTGGYCQVEAIERVSITCSSGKYVGCIPKNKLSMFLRELKRGCQV